MAGAPGPARNAAGEGLEAAHRLLMQRKDLQFDLPSTAPPAPPSKAPRWLTDLLDAIGQIFSPLGSMLEVLFWVLIAAAVLGLIYLVAREAGLIDFAIRRKARPTPADYRPDAETARALLADADQLAAQGRYAEAVHVLLLRSIDDMQRFRPGSVRPAATSRDLAGLEVLPGEARPLFARMAERVEISLFGARKVDAQGYADSRAAYEAFAFPKVWA